MVNQMLMCSGLPFCRNAFLLSFTLDLLCTTRGRQVDFGDNIGKPLLGLLMKNFNSLASEKAVLQNSIPNCGCLLGCIALFVVQ